MTSWSETDNIVKKKVWAISYCMTQATKFEDDKVDDTMASVQGCHM